ncbi:hypothetical protein LWE61_16970 [Sphingobium sufflavum]|uniref:hypothetical protein n=1 Tax=Sphingobium sufflavum TaxID=1129547 RepID=UPI001F24A224|nr:hypothetical protein [Sphingobium sufflavum]MCE7798232.1 hypothetical protein [Sphingobium sufflavum]
MFNNPFSMVVAIVAIVSIASILRARYGLPDRQRSRRAYRDAALPDTAENQQLRDEIKALKDRVAVLERLATDSNSALEREFDKLRQQD